MSDEKETTSLINVKEPRGTVLDAHIAVLLWIGRELEVENCLDLEAMMDAVGVLIVCRSCCRLQADGYPVEVGLVDGELAFRLKPEEKDEES